MTLYQVEGTDLYVKCKNCSSPKIVKHGYNYTVRGKIQRYFCKDCNHNFN